MLCGDTAAEPLYLFINEHLLHPLDRGQPHWKQQPPITSSLHCISRAGAPPISAHRARVQAGEGTPEPPDAGEVAFALLRRSRRSPVLAARLLAASPRCLGLRLLGYGAFPALLGARLRSRQTAPYTWAPQLSATNGLRAPAVRRKRAHLPSSPPGGPASRQFGGPTCDAAQWRLSASAGPAPQGTPANERLAGAGRALCPPPRPGRRSKPTRVGTRYCCSTGREARHRFSPRRGGRRRPREGARHWP